MDMLVELTLGLWTRAAALGTRIRDEQDGFSTAELLGNAALGIAALVVIWLALQQLGVDVIETIRARIASG